MLYTEIIAVCSKVHRKQINTMSGQNLKFLRAFAELRKATLSFVMAVFLSVRPSFRMEHLVSPWVDFHKI